MVLALMSPNEHETIQWGRRPKQCPSHHAQLQRMEAQLPMEESWAYYWRLLRQQLEVFVSGADVEALGYGISRFPALRRITVTPAAPWVWA